MEKLVKSDTKSIGKNIAKLREKRGLTLDGLAELSLISRATISSIENGNDNARVQTIWSLADALGTNFASLIGDLDSVIVEDDGVSVRLVDKQTLPQLVETYILDIPENTTRHAEPHISGVIEHVTVLSGKLLVGARENSKAIYVGQSTTFNADVPHLYSAMEESCRAVVTVVYPIVSFDIGITQSISWPINDSDWKNISLVLERSKIEVQNGLNANAIAIDLPKAISLESATEQLRNYVSAYSKKNTIRLYICAQENKIAIILLYRTAQMFGLPSQIDEKSNPLHKRCFNHANVATSEKLSDLNKVKQAAHNASTMIESSLASEALTRHGDPTVPCKIESMNYQRNSKLRKNTERLFEARIDVDAYEAFELVHPAYARQVLALSAFLPQNENPNIIDIGTGPGLPMQMLLELRPDIRFVAVDPSEVAVRHLKRRFSNKKNIDIKQVSITDIDIPALEYDAAISIGASHHLDTAEFLTAIRQQLNSGKLLLISDEMISSFADRDQRQAALIRHHLWYILDTLILVPESAHENDVKTANILRRTMPLAQFLAHKHKINEAIHLIREVYEEISQLIQFGKPTHPLAVFSRFHILELQALIAGFDYEVEQKTFPTRFISLAENCGFTQKFHSRIYATDGDDEFDAGTHLFVLEAR